MDNGYQYFKKIMKNHIVVFERFKFKKVETKMMWSLVDQFISDFISFFVCFGVGDFTILGHDNHVYSQSHHLDITVDTNKTFWGHNIL
jgi:hypothetical protein